MLTLTNDVSQETVLAVTDRINADHGIDGRGYLVTVEFSWDQRPKRTIISLYGTNADISAAWRHDMARALRVKFEEIFGDGEKK